MYYKIFWYWLTPGFDEYLYTNRGFIENWEFKNYIPTHPEEDYPLWDLEEDQVYNEYWDEIIQFPECTGLYP